MSVILPSVEVQVSSNNANRKGEGASQSRRGVEKKTPLELTLKETRGAFGDH